MPTRNNRPSAKGIVPCAFLMLAVPFHATAQVDFRGFGILPGAASSDVRGVSADGSTVVGMMHIPAVPPGPSDTWAIRWTFAGGPEHLVPQSPLFRATVAGVSGDGSVIVGDLSYPGRPNYRYYWTRDAGFVSQVFSATFAVSDNGVYAYDQDLNFFVPRRRRLSDNTTEELGSGFVTGSSSDGNIVVGSFGPFPGGAWRWTQSTGQVSLGTLPDGMNFSEPYDMTPDGSVVVGSLRDADSRTPYRWTESSGYELLTMLPTGLSAIATDVAADGRTVVGYTELANNIRQAAIWLPDGTVNDLDDYLDSLGANLSGWTLNEATGISDDGLTIAGNGLNPNGVAEGWVVRIPSPATGAFFLLPLFIQRRRRS